MKIHLLILKKELLILKLGKIKLYKRTENNRKYEKEFKIEKELLLALMGIETNFGKYLGKMDIVLRWCLSFDKEELHFY